MALLRDGAQSKVRGQCRAVLGAGPPCAGPAPPGCRRCEVRSQAVACAEGLSAVIGLCLPLSRSGCRVGHRLGFAFREVLPWDVEAQSERSGLGAECVWDDLLRSGDVSEEVQLKS